MNDTPTPTPITDDLSETFDYRGLPCLKKSVELSRALELKLTAAREEITLLETNLKIQTKHTENAVQDRADEHIELHNQIHEVTEQRDAAREEINTLKTMCISNANEANDLRQQRDRLAEALERVMKHFRQIAGDCQEEEQSKQELIDAENAEKALQALTTKDHE